MEIDAMFPFLRSRKARAAPPVATAAAIAFTIVVWDASSGRYVTITAQP